MNTRKIIILLTTTCHLDRMEIYGKILKKCNIPNIRSGCHNKTNDCRDILKKIDYSILIIK